MKALLIGSLIVVFACEVQAQYNVTQICTAGGFAAPGRYQINKGGQIAGQTTSDGTHNWAFCWSPSTANGATGSLVALATGAKGNRAEAHSLNDLGDVVGSIFKPQGTGPLATYKHMAAIWPKGGSPVTLDPNVFQTEGEGVNNAGDVAMFYNSSNAYAGAAVSRVVNGKRKSYLLGSNSLWPCDMNQGAQVVSINGGQLWTPNATKTAWSLSPTGIGRTCGISDRAVVVGTVGSPDGQDHPAFYDPQTGVTSDLFTDLVAALRPTQITTGWRSGVAMGVSPGGIIVGYIETNTSPDDSEAWMRYPDGTIVSLGAPIAPLGWTLFAPNDVNDYGQVVGVAQGLDGSRYCVLLTPSATSP